MTHSVTRNPAKRNTTFKAAVFLVSLASIFKPLFSVLRKKDSFLSILPCSLQSLHMIYSSLSCEVSSKIHLFTIFCNNLLQSYVLAVFLKWIKAECKKS